MVRASRAYHGAMATETEERGRPGATGPRDRPVSRRAHRDLERAAALTREIDQALRRRTSLARLRDRVIGRLCDRENLTRPQIARELGLCVDTVNEALRADRDRRNGHR